MKGFPTLGHGVAKHSNPNIGQMRSAVDWLDIYTHSPGGENTVCHAGISGGCTQGWTIGGCGRDDL